MHNCAKPGCGSRRHALPTCMHASLDSCCDAYGRAVVDMGPAPVRCVQDSSGALGLAVDTTDRSNYQAERITFGWRGGCGA